MTAPDPFAGVITAADVYAKLEAVREAVRAVEVKVDLAAGALAELRARLADAEDRLRHAETRLEADAWPYRKLTAAVAVAGLIIALASLIMKG